MRISQLEGRTVALWGWGREGHAAWRAIRAQLPTQPLTLLCSAAEAEEAALPKPVKAPVPITGAAWLRACGWLLHRCKSSRKQQSKAHCRLRWPHTGMQ